MRASSVVTVGLMGLLLGVARPALAACGDGILDAGEACDDGNLRAGDGCSPTCTVESGFSCPTATGLTVKNAHFEIQPSAADWQLVSGTIDWQSNTQANACWPSGDGSYSIDLNGSSQGVLAQALATVPGTTYAVHFLGSANCVTQAGVSCASTCTRLMTLGVADDTGAGFAADIPNAYKTVEYTMSGSPQAVGWQPFRFQFTAKSASTILYFSGSDTALAGPMLDAVVIPDSDCQPSACGNGIIDAGETCDDGNTVGGDGCDGNCHTEAGYTCATPGQPCVPACGDGTKQNTEGCDDGNTTPGDGCSATCTVETGWACTVTPPATGSLCTCAPGYQQDPSGACVSIDPCATGNGGCDANATCDGSTGSPVCTCNSGYTGDGTTCTKVDPCTQNNGGCDANATCDSSSGSAVCTCDAGYTGDGTTCALPSCGDGILDTGEACDDGNNRAGDGCAPDCTVEAGTTCETLTPLTVKNQSFETPLGPSNWQTVTGTTDRPSDTDGNACWPAGDGHYSIDLNGSSQGVLAQVFTTEPGKTYGVQFLGDANCVNVSGQSCASTCSRALTVGAADATDADLAKDVTTPFATAVYQTQGSPQSVPWQPLRFEFTAQSTSTVLFFSGSDTHLAGPMIDDVTAPTSDCHPTSCGNGTLDPGEVCDDGNNMSGDGCSSDCQQIEVGYTCATPGQACTSSCGDGIKQSAESCDDGNTTAGDGCSAKCTVETGWQCTVTPPATGSVCSCAPGYALSGKSCVASSGSTTNGSSVGCAVAASRGSGNPSSWLLLAGLGVALLTRRRRR